MVHIPGSRETLPKHWLTNRFNVVFHPQNLDPPLSAACLPFRSPKNLYHTPKPDTEVSLSLIPLTDAPGQLLELLAAPAQAHAWALSP